MFQSGGSHTKRAAVISPTSGEELAALSHDRLSVVLPSVKHTLTRRADRAHPEILTAV